MDWLIKLLQLIVALFNRPKLTLPHPEEPVNPAQTAENVNVPEIVTKWLTEWQVPQSAWDFWRNKIEITVDPNFGFVVNGTWQSFPAGTWSDGERRFMKVRPEWLNPGVIAHEQAHNSYSILSSEEKTHFEAAYIPLSKTDPLIRLVLSRKPLWDNKIVEAHAELYRYLGEQMPAQLKQYYPELF